MKIPQGFKGVGVSLPAGMPAPVQRAAKALDALEFGLIASTKEVATMAGVSYHAFRCEYSGHPALNEYRYKKGSSVYWGNRKSINKLIEANAQ